MSRNINLYGQESKKLNHFDNIKIENTNRIINYSVDTLYCECLNEHECEQQTILLHQMLQKLRVGGNLILSFINAKIIAKAYYDNILTDNEIVQFFTANKCLLSIDKINEYIDEQYIVSKIEYLDYNIVVSITRISIE